ncbi:MAG: lysylphosphatidylglycerol synthase transmembrane domain-containing protein [Chloroflexota bacterium]
MTLKGRPIIRGAIGVLLGSAVLYLLFQRISPLALLNELAQADWIKLIWATVFIGLSYVCRSALWKALMHRFHHYNYGAVFRSTMIGYLLNNILPARLGDVARGVSLRLTRGGNSGSIFGSLALERILDVSILISSLGILLIYLNLHYVWLVRSVIILGSLVIAFFVITAILKWWVKHHPLSPPLVRMEKWVSRLAVLKNSRAFIANLGDSVGLSNARRGILWLLATWLVTFWGLYFAFDSLNLTRQLGLLQVALILSIASLGLAIPSLPASLGTYQAAFVFGARLVGLADTSAVSASFLYQGLWVVITSVLGLISMAWEGISFKRLLTQMGNQGKDGMLSQ